LIVKKKILFLLFFTMVIAVGKFNHNLKKPIFTITRSEEALNFSSIFLKLTSLGNKRFYSSILWTHTLLSGDLEHYKNNDLSSWMYLRFDAITDLDPFFYEAYLYGGRYLSIIKDDLIGAEALLLKGLKFYPNDYWLLYYTAFNYYFEMQEKETGILYYKKLINHPKANKINPTLSTLLAGMVARQGNYESSIQILKNSIATTTKPEFKKRCQTLIIQISIEKDLHCLNNKNKNCNTIDPMGLPYIKKNGIFDSQTKRRKFK
jgi:tetratricopeptide (TPR) repeat protein